MNYNLVAYAQDFSSFLLQHLKEPDKIHAIILFGSVVRGEAKKSSDIDLFIETLAGIEEEIAVLKEKFLSSIKVKKYWVLLGIQNEFHCETGSLNEWKDLEKSLHAQGVVLFGKYHSRKDAKPYYLFTIEQARERKQSISLWRKLYGYTQKVNQKIYAKKGLLEEYAGEKIARGVFIIPAEHAQKIQQFLRKNAIRHKVMFIGKENT